MKTIKFIYQTVKREFKIKLLYYHVTNGGQPTVERVKKYNC